MKKYMFFVVSILIIFITGCTSPNEDIPRQEDEKSSTFMTDEEISLRRNNPYQIIGLDKEEKEAAQGERTFSINLFKECSNDHTDKNVVISPFSVYESLLFLTKGAGEEEKKTYSELLFSDLNSIERYHKKTQEAFPILDNGTRYISHNSLWFDTLIKFKENFVKGIEKFGSVELFNQSPEGEKGKDAINNWVKQATEGLIPEFLSFPLEAADGWIFLNTIYFSSHWKTQFDPKLETMDLFTDSKAQSGTIKYLGKYEAFYYYGDEDVSVVELPSWNKNYRMTLYMPSEPLDSWLQDFSKEDIDRYHSNCKNIYLYLRIPKFNIFGEMQFYPIIKKLSGGKSLKLTAMLESGVAYVNNIFQKVILGVDEEGVHAAATTLTNSFTMDSPIHYKDIIFDHPFVFVIEETSTGTILFTGKMVSRENI